MSATDTSAAPETARALDTPFEIGGVDFVSRLIVGTGKYETNEIMMDAIRASAAEMVTVAVRRVDLDRTKEEAILHHLSPDEFFLLANTAGCYNAEDAIRYLKRVVAEHEGTPWAFLAQRELSTPLGWKWNDEFRNLAERRQQENTRPPRPERPEPPPKPRRTPKL